MDPSYVLPSSTLKGGLCDKSWGVEPGNDAITPRSPRRDSSYTLHQPTIASWERGCNPRVTVPTWLQPTIDRRDVDRFKLFCAISVSPEGPPKIWTAH